MATSKSGSPRHRGTRFAKPVFAVLVAVAALTFVTSLALPLLVSTDAAKDRLEQAVSNWLGARVAIDGSPELSLLPDLRLTLADVRLEGRDGQWSMDCPLLSASLDPASIIGGDFAPEYFTIANPDIRLVATSGDENESEPPLHRAKRELARLFRRQLSIRGGTITFGSLGSEENSGREIDPGQAVSMPRVMALNATFSADENGENAQLDARFDYAGERFDLALGLSDAEALTGKHPGTLALEITSPSIDLNLNGRITGKNADRVEGSLAVSSGNVARLIGSGDAPGEGPSAIKTVRLSGEGNFSLQALEFDRATLDVDGNIAEGRLSLSAISGRPGAEGTLAFDSLDLSAFVPAISSLLEDGGQASRPLSALLGASDIDLRLSAANVKMQGAVLGRSALALLMKEGNLTIDVSEAGIADGTGRAHLRLAPASGSHDLYTLEASAELKNATPVASFGIPLLPRGGRASMAIQARSKGETAALLRRKLAASIRFEFTGNGVEELDLDREIAALGRPAISDAGSGTSTPLARLEISGRKSRDNLEIDAIDAETGQYSISLHGTLRQSDGALSLQGTARSLPTESADDNADEVSAGASQPKTPFQILGTLEEPLFMRN